MQITLRDERGTGVYKDKQNTELELRPGLIFLAGCNGAGKTTLLLDIIDTFKKAGLRFKHFDWRGLARETNLDVAQNPMTTVAANFRSEHEATELHFFDWVGTARPTETDKPFGLFIDGLDSGGDVFFYRQHLSFFKSVIQDAKQRGIEFYLIVTCNNFYYLSHAPEGSNILWMPSLAYAEPYQTTEFDKYTEDVLNSAKLRGFTDGN